MSEQTKNSSSLGVIHRFWTVGVFGFESIHLDLAQKKWTQKKRIADLKLLFPFHKSIHPNHFRQYLPKKENSTERKTLNNSKI